MITDHKIVGKPRHDNPGAKAWDLMFELMKLNKPFLEARAAEFDLTPQQAYTFRLLAQDQPVPMNQIAVQLGCDASNVTAIVDKLESRGYVERRASDHDRRVKALVLTPQGEQIYAVLRERMQLPPPSISGLSADDQLLLCEILTRAIAAASAAK